MAMDRAIMQVMQDGRYRWSRAGIGANLTAVLTVETDIPQGNKRSDSPLFPVVVASQQPLHHR